jgi:hypothetical protein
VHSLCQAYIGSKIIWTHPMVVLGDETQVEAHSSPFGHSANLNQDRCMVCVKRTIGPEIVLYAPDVQLVTWVYQSSFWSGWT